MIIHQLSGFFYALFYLTLTLYSDYHPSRFQSGDETNIQGDSNSRKGSLIGLRDNEKIKIIIQ